MEMFWGQRLRGCGAQDGGPPRRALAHQGALGTCSQVWEHRGRGQETGCALKGSGVLGAKEESQQVAVDQDRGVGGAAGAGCVAEEGQPGVDNPF